MNKIFRIIQTYLIYAFPLVLVVMAWSTLNSSIDLAGDVGFITKISWEVLSWNLMIWFGVLIAFLIALVVWPPAREKTLKRLANLKERDEREQYITGKASRTAYISTLSLLVLLLFFSIFSLNVKRLPEAEAVNGKKGSISIGLGFNLLDKPKFETSADGRVVFESKDIPLSKTAILLILLVWQIAAFNITARKESVGDLG